jgi:hypothetical protein
MLNLNLKFKFIWDASHCQFELGMPVPVAFRVEGLITGMPALQVPSQVQVLQLEGQGFSRTSAVLRVYYYL